MWNTVPNVSGVMRMMRGGWLTFQSPSGLRRLVPVPSDWETATPTQLRDYLARAETVERANTGSRAAGKPES